MERKVKRRSLYFCFAEVFRMQVLDAMYRRGAFFLVFLVLTSGLATAAPRIEHWVAPSGARVYFVENRALPILDVQVDFTAGSASDPADKPGLASMTHALLDMGAAGMDENAISTRLADLGAQLSGSVSADRASLSLRTLSASASREPALKVLGAVLSSPQFPAAVFEREKARTIAALKEAMTRPDTIASRAFWAALYPQHPYGRHTTPESLTRITKDDLERFYRTHYRAGGAVVNIVGDLTRAEAEAVATALTASLPSGRGPGLQGHVELQAGKELRLAHPAAQAHVLIGLPALRRGDPDFFPLQVGNYTLGGGGFVSRLMREVREKRGFAYSVYSGFVPLEQLGPFQISLQTSKEQANEALRVVRDVVSGFMADGPSEDELRAAKQYLSGSFPLRLDNNRKLLDNVAVIGFYGLPLDYLDSYVDKVEQVTAADVRAAFARHVLQDKLVTVVVGGE